ncbi:hypothetical protein [Rubrobacter calidifluminis]|uniref:hypothetical protein n=1 Tax=Rubrobacter calidifluminis TaxID=1392640 RepID=UPI0023623881|nr:hypothetical protein [Rubrobacter calidifluminis]
MPESFLERMLLLQAGAVSALRERVQMTVNVLVELGRVELEESGGNHGAKALISQLNSLSEGSRDLLEIFARQGLRSAGLADEHDAEGMRRRLEYLESRIQRLEESNK